VKLVQQIDKSIIFNFSEIPIYIQYFMFNSCPKIILGPTEIDKMGLKSIKENLMNFQRIRIEHIQQGNIETDLININTKIQEYNMELKTLHNIKKTQNLTLEQKAEKVLLKEEIKDLIQRQNYLNNILRTSSTNSNGMSGGLRPKPSEQYLSNIMYNPQYNQQVYPQNSNMPANVVYLPRETYPYPYQYPYNSTRYNYNVAQNKEKDKKSKLSFYITVELELFPGTSASVLQKSVVKCQSTFERIREAWADIFGFEYRPAPMSEAYAYNYEKKDSKSKTEKNRDIEGNKESDKKKTRKNRN
jgi:hypothetical protein